MANQNLTTDQQQAVLGQAYNNAYSTLLDQVWGPVFFQKLSQDWGVSPQNQEEVEKLTALAHRLRAGHQNDAQKQSPARSSVLDQVLNDVDRVLERQGVVQPAQDTFIHQAKAAAATAVNQNPELRDAALLYQDFLVKALNG